MEISRKFNVADAVLLEFAGKGIKFLATDLPIFTNFDPDLTAGKVTKMENVYKSILSFGTDKSEVEEVSKLTENLAGEFKNCTSIYKEVRYFANKKFGKSPAVIRLFGLDSYRKARKKQPTMVVFMHELGKSVEKYKTELMEAGLKESVIASIEPATLALENSNVDQEVGKDSRPVKTEGRIELLNTLYDMLLEFSSAAKIVFAKDALKRDRYILPHNRSIGGNDAGTSPK